MTEQVLNMLNKWAEYTKYNRDQKSFNLNSYEYQFNSVGRRIERVVNEYDESGFIGLVLAKQAFMDMTKDAKIVLSDFLANPDGLKAEQEMYNMFQSKEIKDAENNFFNLVDSIVQKIINKPMIGEANDEENRQKILNSVEKVITSLDKCRSETFQKSGMPIGAIEKFSTQINVFDSLANCLLTLSNAEDGIYLCYIDIYKSADSYFSFFIKSNGNIVSVNERIDEAFKGSHQRSRNGRWSESKADDIFPYDHIFSFCNYDYKGYSHTYEIDNDKLSFFELGEDVYLPILLAMIFLANRFQNKTVDNIPLVYVDSLLKVNIPSLTSGSAELAVIQNNQIVVNHQNLNLDFDVKKVLDGSALQEFRGKGLSHDETFNSGNYNQFLVDLYGEGFTFNPDDLYVTPNVKMLNGEVSSYPVEYVGSERRQRAQGYYIVRKQLADYIRKNIQKEYENFGGIKKVKEWYTNLIKKYKYNIEELILREYDAIQNGDKTALLTGWRTSDTNISTDVYYMDGHRDFGWYDAILINNYDLRKEEMYDERTGAKCSMYFGIAPKDYKSLELLFGEEVPKIVKGWSYDGHRASGNYILSLTDAVETVGTPFERTESEYYKDLPYNERPEFDFKILFGYSKRGFKQMRKEHEANGYKYVPSSSIEKDSQLPPLR